METTDEVGGLDVEGLADGASVGCWVGDEDGLEEGASVISTQVTPFPK
jgi:hypothetical protein